MALEEIVIDAKGQYIIDIDGFVLPITNLFYDGEDCESMDIASTLPKPLAFTLANSLGNKLNASR